MKPFVFFALLSLVNSECALFTLYKDPSVQRVVRRRLSDIFELKFAQTKEEARTEAPYLVPAANHFKSDIRKHFIDYGYDLKDYADLDIILKSLNYLSIEVFKEYKRYLEKFGPEVEFEEWITKPKNASGSTKSVP